MAKDKFREHIEFLNECFLEKAIGDEVYNDAVVFFGIVPGVQVPRACTGSDGQMLYLWSKDHHRLEIEYLPGKPAELFYWNQETDETRFAEWDEGPIPQIFLDKLKIMGAL
jgi:hypothetical protein